MFDHTVSFYNSLLKLFYLSLCSLLLSACAEDFSFIFNTINNETLTPGTIESASNTIIMQSTPLQILKQPISKRVEFGNPFTLSASARSDRKIIYQWYRNNSPIFGAISPVYNVLSANSFDQGSYYLVVKDGKTSLRTNTAIVSVHTPETTDIELTWDTPRFREDGTKLEASEIEDYIIEYGRNFLHPDQSIRVQHRHPNHLVLHDIKPGTLYLRIATIDSDGLQGAFSPTISVTID